MRPKCQFTHEVEVRGGTYLAKITDRQTSEGSTEAIIKGSRAWPTSSRWPLILLTG